MVNVRRSRWRRLLGNLVFAVKPDGIGEVRADPGRLSRAPGSEEEEVPRRRRRRISHRRHFRFQNGVIIAIPQACSGPRNAT